MKIAISVMVTIIMVISLQAITTNNQTDQTSASDYPGIKLGLAPGAYNDMFNGDK